MTVVSNAGPLIALARIEKTEFLPQLYGDIVIPPAVREEVIGTDKERKGAETLASAEWLHTVPVSNQMGVTFLRERLDAGESEAIVLALELGADFLLIDEAPGRKRADARGIPLTGTLGVLLFAKEQRLIDTVAPVLDQLVHAGFRMGEDLYREILRLAGEL